MVMFGLIVHGDVSLAFCLLRLRWKDLVAQDPETEEILHDKKGKDGSLRVGIPVRDTVVLSNFREKLKEFGTEKTEKDLDAVTVELRKKELTMLDAEDDAMGLGAQMVKSGSAGNCFTGNNFDIDLGALQKEVSEELAESGDENAADEDAAESVSVPAASDLNDESNGQGKGKRQPNKPQPKKKTKAWDKSTIVASKIRSETTSLCTFELQLKRRLSECQDCLAEVAAKGQACADETRVEQQTLSKRVSFLVAVLGKETEALSKLIKSYEPGEVAAADAKAQAAQSSATVTVATSWHSQLTGAPPCERYRELQTLSFFQNSVEDLWNANTAAELKEMVKQRSEARKPIAELAQASNIGLKELKKAMASFDARAKAKATVPVAAKKASMAASSPGAALFEKGLELASPVPEAMVADLEVIDKSLPCLLKLQDSENAILQSDSWPMCCSAFCPLEFR